MFMQPKDLAASDRRALAEHRRISQEIRALEAQPPPREAAVLGALRACRVALESDLKRRGWCRVEERWTRPGARPL